MCKKFFIFLLQIIPFTMFAQIPIGQWSDHLPYGNVISVTDGGGVIYAATSLAVFAYHLDDQSIDKISTVNGLSQIGITRIAYDNNLKKLIIAFDDGNINIIENGSQIVNVPDIKNSSIIGDKEIYNVKISGNYAYLACGFGIVYFDLQNDEVKDTYIYGNNNSYVKTNDVTIYNDTIYAAGDHSIYEAPVNASNLADFNNWHKMTPALTSKKISFLTAYAGKMFAVIDTSAYDKDSVFTYNGTQWQSFGPLPRTQVNDMRVSNGFLCFATDYHGVYFNQNLQQDGLVYSYGGNTALINTVIVDDKKQFWIGDRKQGLVFAQNSDNYRFLTPDGPSNADAFKLAVSDNNLWVISGAWDGSFFNTYHPAGFHHYSNHSWTSIVRPDAALDTISDIVDIAIDPDDPGHVFGGSWGKGLIEIKNDKVVNVYDNHNSPLQSNLVYQHVSVGGLKYDSDGNLWMSNANSQNGLLVLKKDGTWQSFELYPYSNNDATLTHIAIDEQGKIWILNSKDNTIIVFDDGGTIDDKSDDQVVELSKNNGFMPAGSKNYCITKDNDGEMWVGTNEGPVVFSNTAGVMDNDASAYGQQILLTQDGNVQVLLQTEIINSIAIDGANRKWFGTETGGAFLMSADGTQQIQHFDKSNSPLYSNDVTSIAINQSNGEVFMGTDAGIISYGGDATEGLNYCDSLYAFPNPVAHNYTGTIAIRGLFAGSDVRISDLAGHLVYQTTALGGQAIWDGKNMNGKRVNTGIYPVYCTSSDGKNTCITKIMVVN